MKFGLIPFFIPHAGCPHTCVFCNQHRITYTKGTPSQEESSLYTEEEIYHRIREYTKDIPKGSKYWEVAFYGGSFTAIPVEEMNYLLRPATKAIQEGLIDGIRCSTRPDAIDTERLTILKLAGVTTVELGVQSMDNSILEASERGHTAEQVRQAVTVLKENGFTVGLQLMPGLPKENWVTWVRTVVAIAKLKPDFVRLYPVIVMEDTALAQAYMTGTYMPLSLEEAISYAAFGESYLKSYGIPSIRTGLQPTDELSEGESIIAGPYHPAFGELAKNEIAYLVISKAMAVLERVYGTNKSMYIRYPRSLTSIVKGQKLRNVKRLRETFSAKIIFEEVPSLGYIGVSCYKTTCMIRLS